MLQRLILTRHDPESELYKKSLEVTDKMIRIFSVAANILRSSIAHGDPQKWAWSDDWWWGILYTFKNKGVDIYGILLLRTLIGKIFGSIGSVRGGLALGKEGPLVHTGACIVSLLGQVRVAAVFRAPVGGVLFALEEVEELTYMACLLHFCYCCCCSTNCNGMV
ncbi:hypothetical protein AHAS_Ahas14G0169900 [Arachis hypogaea]